MISAARALHFCVLHNEEGLGVIKCAAQEHFPPLLIIRRAAEEEEEAGGAQNFHSFMS
jgi:hypothetical protein